MQNTYRKSAKWVISEAKGIITSPTEEYYIYKFFVRYNIEKANLYIYYLYLDRV